MNQYDYFQNFVLLLNGHQFSSRKFEIIKSAKTIQPEMS